MYPATDEHFTVALNTALEAGDLVRIMRTMAEMTRAHRMKRVAEETGLGRESLYKSVPSRTSPEFNTVLRVLQALGFRLQVHPEFSLRGQVMRMTPSPRSKAQHQ